jgi:hypothetical protein
MSCTGPVRHVKKCSVSGGPGINHKHKNDNENENKKVTEIVK